MRDWGGAPAAQRLLAETLGLAMARRAADILGRHRDRLRGGAPGAAPADPAEFAADDAVFTAVLDAAGECLGGLDGRPAGECLGGLDGRPAGDRWCDALLQLLQLARAGGADR